MTENKVTDSAYSRSAVVIGEPVEASPDASPTEQGEAIEQGEAGSIEETDAANLLDEAGNATPTEQVEAAGEPDVQAQLAELAEIKRMLKDSPEQLARKYGMELFSSRFGKLAKKSAAIRAQEKALEQKAAAVKNAEETIARIEADPIAFVQERIGTGAYKEWTRRILKESGAEVEDLPGHDDAKKAPALDKDELIREAKEAALAEFKAGQFFDEVARSVNADAFPALASVGQDGVQRRILALDKEARDKGLLTPGQLLPIGEALGILEERELEKLRNRVNHASIREALGIGGEVKPPDPPVKRASANQSPATLTNTLQTAVSRAEEGDEENLSRRERIARIAARYS